MELMLCSCLITRNLLSGLKTCQEVASYMHAGGASMPHRYSAATSSLRDDNRKTDAEYTVRIARFTSSIFFHIQILLCRSFFFWVGRGGVVVKGLSIRWLKFKSVSKSISHR